MKKINLIWWYWFTTVILLIIGVSFQPLALLLAIMLTSIQVLHFYVLNPQISDFAVQVRIAYLLLLLLALIPELFFIFHLQIIGTLAMVLFNYCFLARLMSLMPWNRSEKYSVILLKQTFLSKPVNGSIQNAQQSAP